MIHDDTENGRLDMGPVGVVLGDRDEIGTQEHAGHAGYPEQALGQRRIARGFDAAEIARLTHQHVAPRQEFEGRGIGRGFGLDEHRGACGLRLERF
ncbi:hypothetical protein D3C86_1832540 [compost metagenome]